MKVETIAEAVDASFGENVYKCVLSGPVAGKAEYRRIELDLRDGSYFVEKRTETQAFHERMEREQAKEFLLNALGAAYKNLSSWDGSHAFSVKISKKGKVLFLRRAVSGESAPKARSAHDRQKNYILEQGAPIPPLVDMGIFTEDGKIISAMYDKYRQINRFIEIIDDEVKKSGKRELSILDFGCGKSYLTFILYHYFTAIKDCKVRMTGLDLKAGVIAKCNDTARKYGYGGLSFQVGDIGGFQPGEKPDIVISLHACDTATDHALYNAVSWGADMIFSAPCCQHELNGQIHGGDYGILTRYGVVKERVASLMTDAVRANLLECCGYGTQMIEFVPFDHTPKNIMLRAVKKSGGGAGSKGKYLAEVEALMSQFHLDPAFYRLLKASGKI